MTRLIAVFASLVVVFLAACSADRPPTPQGTAGSAPECDPELDEAFRAWEAGGFSGSVAIATDGEFDCVAGYGTADETAGTPNTPATVFGIGSVSKAFTAAAVLDLVGDGSLSLDDRAGELIPELTGPAADATVEQLLLHTSGLTGSHGSDHQPLDRDGAVAAIGALDQAFEPGSDFLYSNAGYSLLALVVEEVSGTAYRDHLRSEILALPDGVVAGGFWDGEPAAAGPRAVGYHDDGSTGEHGDFTGPHWALTGNGDLAMTMTELASWTDALFTGRIGSAATAEAIGTAGFDHGDGTAETPGWVAFDVSVHGAAFLLSSGGGGELGHDVVVAWFPGTEQVIAIASNTADVNAADLLQSVGPSLAAGDRLPRPSPTGNAVPADVEAALGTYPLESGASFEVTAGDRRLVIAADGAEAVAALFPLPEAQPADAAEDHEEAVVELLAGGSAAGREEREALEAESGPIEEIAVMGTVVEDGELRTYVTATSSTAAVTAWYALDEHGAVAAAALDPDLPTLRLVASDDGLYRPDDPASLRPELTVDFDAAGLTISGPHGTTSARRQS